jgi:hypothetical protein
LIDITQILATEMDDTGHKLSMVISQNWSEYCQLGQVSKKQLIDTFLGSAKSTVERSKKKKKKQQRTQSQQINPVFHSFHQL